ncbi:MAG: bifunctional phosphopantothenoylcysteine decarboxylase/phosphopantothenate--cysteine ligase CoaBC, partial [Microthrixaceae bacterium]
MSALSGRRVVLGVCGGIAAYKAVDVCRRLMDAGAHVSVVMTDSATKFVGEQTFSALSSEPVRTSLWGDAATPIAHTRLGQEADLVVVAPATARLVSAYASGYSHDLLTNVLIATTAPVLVCPAMHTEMWEHPATRDNVARLLQRGVTLEGPEVGHLAGGDSGAGRLAEPADIVRAAERLLASESSDAGLGERAEETARAPHGASRDMAGMSVLVTAGGTREAIDPVRFLGNRSSGKQGHAVAAAAALRGAEVVLITTSEPDVAASIKVVRVESAREMHDAVLEVAPRCEVVVMAAAVADFTPVATAQDKLKKRDGTPTVELKPTADILAALGDSKADGQVLVGFAAETNDVVAHARDKLVAKGADLLVANDVSAEGVGFEHDTNEVLILSAGGETHVPLTDKLT